MVDKQELLKKKKKKWYNILAGKEFNNALVGESYVDDINFLKGRILKVNLMSVSNDSKKQNMNVSFIVDGIKGDHASASLIGYEIVPSYIRRITKKAKTKIEDSFKGITSDKVKLVIKPMVLARNKINNSVASCVRKTTKEFIADFLSKNDYNSFAKAVIISGSLQKELRDKLNKVTPVIGCMIRVFKMTNK